VASGDWRAQWVRVCSRESQILVWVLGDDFEYKMGILVWCKSHLVGWVNA